MKIDAYRETQTIDSSTGARQVSSEKAPDRRPPAGAEAADQVTLSADAQLLADALKAADSAPDIRMDLVEKMRVKLAAGEVGADPGRLADRMIEGLLEQ